VFDHAGGGSLGAAGTGAFGHALGQPFAQSLRLGDGRGNDGNSGKKNQQPDHIYPPAIVMPWFWQVIAEPKLSGAGYSPPKV
jgi:hypothetical protein